MADPLEPTDPEATDPEATEAEPDADPDQRRRRSDGLIVALNASVVAMSEQLVEMNDKLEGFTTTGEVNKKVTDLESRMNWRSLIGGIAIVVLAAVFAWYSNYKSNQSTKNQFTALAEARHQGQLDNCEQNNTQNQVIRDVVDRSQTQQVDPAALASLSPTAKEILVEFARLQQSGGSGQSFHDFVYDRTPIVNCQQKYPPLNGTTTTTVKPKAKATATTK